MIKDIKYKFQNLIEFLKKDLISKIREYDFILKPLLCIFIICSIAIIPLIRADFNYNDDLGRVALGYKDWEYFSRFGSTFLSTFVHASNYLTDVSPLTQLLAIFIMSLTGIIILYVYKEKKSFSLWDIVAIIPLILSPYFLECLSYKYDSPYMSLSVFASVFPLLFRKKHYIIYSIVIVLCTLLMCITYQASSGIFLMFALLLCFKDWNRGESLKKNLKFLLISVGNFLLGLLLFRIFIMRPVETYVSNSIFLIKELPLGILKNLYKYFSLVYTDFKEKWLVLIAFMVISVIIIFIKDSKRKKYLALPVSILTILFMGILSFGIYPFLTSPLFDPRAMYGFGVFISLIGVAIVNSNKVYLSRIIVLILSWVFIVFSCTYGNALKVQDEYTDFRVNLVISDLKDLEIFSDNTTKKVQISGTIGKSPILKNMPQNYQILNRLVPIQFAESWDWAEFYFFNYFDLRNVNRYILNDLTEYNLPILKDTMYHTIRGNEEFILIELK